MNVIVNLCGLALCLLCCVHGVMIKATVETSTTADAHRPGDIVYDDVDIPLELVGDIHPYAYAYRLPDPHYLSHHKPSASVEHFRSFLELQDHVDAKSEAARFLTSTPEIVETGTLDKYFKRQHAESLLETQEEVLPLLAGSAALAAGAKYLSEEGGKNNPANDNPLKLDAHPSPFGPRSRTNGVFHSSFRRAVYGLRRRRMPFTFNALTSSVNPFRRANSFFNTPPDVAFPRVRLLEALNPTLTDYGKFGGPAVLPYGGYSSFRVFRHREPNPGSIGGLGDTAPFTLTGQSPPWLTGYPQVQDPLRSRVPTWPYSKLNEPHPMGSGPSPFIPGSHSFHNFYGGPAKGGAAGAGGADAGAAGGADAGAGGGGAEDGGGGSDG